MNTSQDTEAPNGNNIASRNNAGNRKSRGGSSFPQITAQGIAYDWLATASLIALTVVVTHSMTRLFVDSSFLTEVLVLAIGSHLLSMAARLMRLPAIVSALIWVTALVVTVTLMFYSDTAWQVLPTGDTLDAARQHLDQAWDTVNASPAPVEPVTGLVLCAGVALALCARLAETAAFVRGSMLVAILPASTVYGFTIAIDASSSSPSMSNSSNGAGDFALADLLSAAFFCGAVAASLLFAKCRDRSKETWVESRPGRGTLIMARSGSAVLAVAIVAGAAVGPRLSAEQPWIDLANLEVTEAAPWADGSDPGPEPWMDFDAAPPASDSSVAAASSAPRTLISPIVQIRSRLTQLSNRELFTVAVQGLPQYWRLTALDEFNGTEWRASSSYSDVDDLLPESLEAAADRASLIQTVALTGLGNSYLPIAYEARRVLHNGGIEMEYEAASSSLIKSRAAALAGPKQFTYAVESAVPVINNGDRLRNAETAMLEADFLEFNTRLPAVARDLVLGEAQQITRNGTSDYHRALLLQDYFRRSGGFRYDLDVAASASIESLEDFLFDVRAGYCQQFASAYAAMARSIGLPTRVAVGFTWGDWDPDRGQQGAYVVRGEHAHAWPEVYFADTGWVRFEPTPGRGAPGDFAVTGYLADQAGSAAVEAFSAVPEAGSSTAGDSSGNQANTSTSVPNFDEAPTEPSEADPSPSTRASSDVFKLLQQLLPVLLLAAAIAFLLGSIPLLRQLRHQQVRAGLKNDPAGLIEEFWSDAVEALALARIKPRPTETPLEFARRVNALLPGDEATKKLADLAMLTTHGRYAPSVSRVMADRAAVAVSAVIKACRSQASRRQRLAAALNPVTVFRTR